MTETGGFTALTEQPQSLATRAQVRRLKERYALAQQLSAGRRVLEVACGSGLGLQVLSRSAALTIGADVDPRLLGLARTLTAGGVPLVRLDAARLPFAEASFDAVVMLEAIYYLQSAERFLVETKRILRPGGSVLIGSVNPEYPEFVPSPRSTRYFGARALAALLADAGFCSVRIDGGDPRRTGARTAVVELLRRLANKLDLIPGSLAARAPLKRIFYGPLTPIGTAVDCDPRDIVVQRVNASGPVTRFQILYATASTPGAPAPR